MNNTSVQPSMRKAAILMASLDAESADRLLAQMAPEQAQLLRRMAEQLDDIAPGERAIVIQEFCRVTPQPATRDEVGLDLTLPMKPAQPTRLPAEPFRFLREARSGRLSGVLGNEHPQTVA